MTASWRGLAWIGWRQHRLALLSIVALLALTAIAMAVTGPPLHRVTEGSQIFGFADTPRWKINDAMLLIESLLLLAPVLAGIFLGAPLIAADAEHRTTQVIWTQAAGREKWFIAQVVPLGVGVALAGAGLGLEWRWWLALRQPDQWSLRAFTAGPLPLAGWMVAGVSLGVLLGAVIRRIVPAMAATVAGYAVLYYLVAGHLRNRYLPPLHEIALRHPTPGGGYSFSYPNINFGMNFLSARSSFPDGHPISDADQARPNSWFIAHHIQLLITYQPASRYGLFQLIEFGLLIAVSAILIGAATVMIRRRPA